MTGAQPLLLICVLESWWGWVHVPCTVYKCTTMSNSNAIFLSHSTASVSFSLLSLSPFSLSLSLSLHHIKKTCPASFSLLVATCTIHMYMYLLGHSNFTYNIFLLSDFHLDLSAGQRHRVFTCTCSNLHCTLSKFNKCA